jgi:hypothetical protein
MTQQQLEAVVDALIGIVTSWNRAGADEGCGSSNHAVHLTLFDDGSGRVGRRRFGGEDRNGMPQLDTEDWHDFRDFGELVKVLHDGEGVEFEGE